MTIPKNITDKIKKFNELREEIKNWFEENADGVEDFNFPTEFIFTDKPRGDEQNDGEYCLQFEIGFSGDFFEGRYYYPTEDGDYLMFYFWT